MNLVKQTSFALLILVIVMLAVPRAFAQKLEEFDGKPEFTEGLELGYYVWRDGDTWHIRWTTTGTKRHFTGLVLAEGGNLKSIKRVDLESDTLVVRRRAPRTTIDRRGHPHTSAGGEPVVTRRRSQDKVEKDGNQRIRFDAHNDGDIDGFDFRVEKNVTALRFTMEINGKDAHKHVKVGKNNSKMLETPFTIKLN